MGRKSHKKALHHISSLFALPSGIHRTVPTRHSLHTKQNHVRQPEIDGNHFFTSLTTPAWFPSSLLCFSFKGFFSIHSTNLTQHLSRLEPSGNIRSRGGRCVLLTLCDRIESININSGHHSGRLVGKHKFRAPREGSPRFEKMKAITIPLETGTIRSVSVNKFIAQWVGEQRTYRLVQVPWNHWQKN